MSLAIYPIPGFNDPVSSMLHLIGALVFAIMGVMLVMRGRGSAAKMISLGIFAFSAVLLLAVSGVFHQLPDGAGRDVMQRVDHAAIFFLIAGTFTPIHVILFRGVLRWGVLAFIWTAAATGITLKTIFFVGFPESLGVALYLGMGWIGLVSMIAIGKTRGARFGMPVVLGGIAYTIGAVIEFAGMPTIIPGAIESHEVFHIAVLVGLGLFWSFAAKIASQPMATQAPGRSDAALARDAARESSIGEAA